MMNILCLPNEMIDEIAIHLDHSGQIMLSHTCKRFYRYRKPELRIISFSGSTPLWDESTCQFAAAGGHFEILRWLHAEGCPLDKQTYSAAAENNHFEILRWLVCNSHFSNEKGCPWDGMVFACAVKNNNLEMVKWLRTCGDCPCNDYVYDCGTTDDHYEVVKFLLQTM